MAKCDISLISVMARPHWHRIRQKSPSTFCRQDDKVYSEKKSTATFFDFDFDASVDKTWDWTSRWLSAQNVSAGSTVFIEGRSAHSFAAL